MSEFVLLCVEQWATLYLQEQCVFNSAIVPHNPEIWTKYNLLYAPLQILEFNYFVLKNIFRNRSTRNKS